MNKKTETLTLLYLAHGEQQALPGSLSAAQRQAQGSLKEWAPKDILAHISGWKARFIDRLEAVAAGRPEPVEKDYLITNDEMFEDRQHWDWEQVLTCEERTFDTLMELFTQFSDDELANTKYLPSETGRPLWRLFLGYGCIHPVMHLAEIYTRAGNPAKAIQLQEMLAEKMNAIEDSASRRSVNQYNLACFYAGINRPDRAIELLGEAFALDIRLNEYAGEDPDLDPLRGHPAFQALMASQAADRTREGE